MLNAEPGAPQVFDQRLDTYYEDADLAWRLRAAGYAALTVPAARALHAGGATGGRRAAWRWRRIHGNRYPVAAGLLGSSFWSRLPRIFWRDLLDLGRSLAHLRLRRSAGIVGGWGRALRLLPGFVRTGPPAPGALTDPAGSGAARGADR